MFSTSQSTLWLHFSVIEKEMKIRKMSVSFINFSALIMQVMVIFESGLCSLVHSYILTVLIRSAIFLFALIMVVFYRGKFIEQ
jgi:hypothetical protein